VHIAASHDLTTSSGSARRSVDTRALEEVLAAVGSERPDLRVPLLCICCSVRMNVLNFETGLRFGQEAVALASLPGSEEQRAEAESTLGMARLGMGDATGALEHLERARREAVANGDSELEGYSLARSALASWMVGRTDEAERAAFSAGQRFESLRHRRGQTLAVAIRTGLAALRGDFTLAEQLGRQCKRLYEQSEYYFAVLLLYPALFEARSALGDAVGAEAALDEWRVTGQGGTGLSRLISLVRAGRLDEARQKLKEDPRLLGFARLPSMISVGVIGALAESAAALEDAGLAAELESCIEKLPDPAAIASSGSLHTLPWSRACSRLLGRPTQSGAGWSRRSARPSAPPLCPSWAARTSSWAGSSPSRPSGRARRRSTGSPRSTCSSGWACPATPRARASCSIASPASRRPLPEVRRSTS
jgi:hypothetical protein